MVKKRSIPVFVACLTFVACQPNPVPPVKNSNPTAAENSLTPPDQLFGQLFEDVQLKQIFPDGKTFPDCTPRFPQHVILKSYAAEKSAPDGSFSLKNFIDQNFLMPEQPLSGYQTDGTQNTEQHVASLWKTLARNPQAVTAGSLISLPKSYVVPGGRFREIYYWDSFFTMLGLKVSGETVLIENMVENFASLIDRFGHIPNGNRTYYLSRSQPPFFSLMVRLLDETQAQKPAAGRPLVRFLPQMEKELAFWMDGPGSKHSSDTITFGYRRLVISDNGPTFNRYFDDSETPRAESFREDVETAKKSGRPLPEMYRHLKAGAESGWDFSSRWLTDPLKLETIHTTDIAPVDLQCLLYHLEKTIGEAYGLAGDIDKSTAFIRRAKLRGDDINDFFWDEKAGFYMDLDWKTGKLTGVKSLAAVYPLYFGIASDDRAARVAAVLEKEFLMPGGLVTTLTKTGQQWDAPNAWPPLQWLAVRGLEKTGQSKLAAEVKKRWLALNENVYKNTGKMMEKYRVDDIKLPTGGGEYPVQDGFGWTNGVYLDLLKN